MQITRQIVFDIDKSIYTTIDAKQNDINSRFIEFTLVNNSLPLNLTGHTVKIFAIKADNTLIFNNVTITNATEGKVLVELTSQALAVIGSLECELVIYGSNNSVLSTKSFAINVIKSIRDDLAVESTNEFTALTEAFSTVQELKERISIATFTATASNTTRIVHNLTYNKLTDELQVYYMGMLLEKADNYIENTDNISINLSGWSLDLGEKIKFVLYKKIK